MRNVWHAKMWFDERNVDRALALIPDEGVADWCFWDDNCLCVVLSAKQSVTLRACLADLRKAFPVTPIYTGYGNTMDLRNINWAAMA